MDGGAPGCDFYGGGNTADVTGGATVVLGWTQLTGNVYGGGLNGNVSGDTLVDV